MYYSTYTTNSGIIQKGSVSYVMVKFSKTCVVKGTVVWYNTNGCYLEFQELGIQSRWFTWIELKELT